MKKESAENKVLNRKELLEKLSSKPERIVDIKGLGKVTVQSPDFDKVVQFAIEHKEIGEKGLKFALALLSVKELAPEDVINLATQNDGFQMASLINSISSIVGLDEESVGKHTKG